MLNDNKARPSSVRVTAGRRFGILDVMAATAIGCGIVVETGGVGDVPWWLYVGAVGLLLLTSLLRTAHERAKARKQSGQG